MILRYWFLYLALTSALWVGAQGIKGRVLNDNGDPLPYSTIYVAQTGSGSITNVYGIYEIRLNPGQYAITFQYLGFATEKVEIVIDDDWITHDIVLQKQAFLLGEAEVKAGKEDPSYAIMRKAIAKSSFHRQQVDRYTCEVYLKGGGGITDAPRFVQKMLEKEGIDTSATFVTESVSRITYTRPGQYEEEVISVRSSGDNRNSSPMSYINGSFYEPKLAGIISPLSPKAFAYYRFQYLSSFSDRGYTIYKINVTPKSRSEDVVSGILYLVDGLWCIHSFEFELMVQGIVVEARQVFAPVKDEVWLPVSHKYDGWGNFFGVKFEFGYLAAVSKYDIEINPDLAVPIVVIDEKTEAEALANRTQRPEISGKGLSGDTEQRLAAGEEISRKELRQLLRDYEKEERKKTDEPEVVSMRTFRIDSLAYKSDSLYWTGRRPVPLTSKEMRGYVLQDSLATEIDKKDTGDTLGTKDGFKLEHLIFGGDYNIGGRNYIKLYSPLSSFGYNTVDGWNFEYRMSYLRRYENKSRLEISPMVRFATARPSTMGTLRTTFNYRNGPRKGELRAEGGWYYTQFNPNSPIPLFQNTISTLIFNNNFIKVYDRNFGYLGWSHDALHNFNVRPEVWYERRIQTFNNTSGVWFPASDRGFTPNKPENLELDNTAFGQSDAFKLRLTLTWQPGLKFGKYNEVYYKRNKAPEFIGSITRAVPGVFDSNIDYALGTLGFKNWFDMRTGGELGIFAEAGLFLHRRNMEFPDFAHFMGNQTLFTRFGQLNGFSLLEYYLWSNSERYLSTYVNYTGRKFALTRIPKLRLTGLKENILFNYLLTPTARSYMEVGYSLTNVFRVARIDFMAGFIDGSYREFRIQIGILSEIFQIN